MKNLNRVQMKINKNYTATVRDLKELENYLTHNQEQIGEGFGEITLIDLCKEDRFEFIVELESIVESFNGSLNICERYINKISEMMIRVSRDDFYNDINPNLIGDFIFAKHNNMNPNLIGDFIFAKHNNMNPNVDFFYDPNTNIFGKYVDCLDESDDTIFYIYKR